MVEKSSLGVALDVTELRCIDPEPLGLHKIVVALERPWGAELP